MNAIRILLLVSLGVYSCVGLQCYKCIGSTAATFDKSNPHCQDFKASEVEKMESVPGGVCTQILLDCTQKGQHIVTLAVRSAASPGTMCTPQFKAVFESVVQDIVEAAGQEVDSTVVKECDICDGELCNGKPF